MRVKLKSTTKIVELIIDGKKVPARLWEGETDKGIPCHAYITRIAVARTDDSAEFERDLQEHAAPTVVVPLSMII